MKAKLLLFLAFTFLALFMMTRVAKAQEVQLQAKTAGAPIKGVIVKGSKSAITEGNPIPGVVIKGGKPGATLTIADDIVIKDLPLLTSLGADALVIAKGNYTFDYSTAGEARAIVHLHKAAIVHRDIAARSFAYQGTDAEGNPYNYTIQPLIENGAVSDMQVTVRLSAAISK